jgi:hypothetical protein
MVIMIMATSVQPSVKLNRPVQEEEEVQEEVGVDEGVVIQNREIPLSV